MLDLVIRGGVVVDGSGSAGTRADVGVDGARIAAIGQLESVEAARVIDATGKVVAPGFVDPHSHSDWTLHANPEAHSTIRQGVTTEIVGNCGIGNAPVSLFSKDTVATRLRAHGHSDGASWRSFADYLDVVAAQGTSQNLAFFVGHSTIRDAAGVGSRAPTVAELDTMVGYVEEAMDAGALGMSTGLEYSTGQYADTREVVELAKVLGRRSGYYASHVRNRDAHLLESVRELLDIVRSVGCAGQVSHLNVRHDTGAPPGAWRDAVDLLEAARHEGVDVEADTTPFRQGLGMMIGILPQWLLSQGFGAVAEQLLDPSVRQRLRGECDRYWRFVHKGQWRRVRLQSSTQFPAWSGMSFPDIAAQAGKDEWDCYFDIVSAAGSGMGDLLLVGDLFTDEHLVEMITHPLFSLGVDSMTSSTSEPLVSVTTSPLSYRGHVEYLARHVRQLHTLSLEEAVHKMSGKPAARFGLKQRGLLRQGWYADLVVFDPETIDSASTFEQPAAYPVGIDAVVVNGRLTVDGGAHTGARAGDVLRRSA